MTTAGADQGKRERPVLIGVTGNIACGKSTVMGMLGELGAELIDADAVYHELIAPHRPLWHALQARFGDAIVSSDGTIDRRALGAIVFADPAALAKLDRITHPAVITAIRDRVAGIQGRVVAVDAVKLIESGMAPLCDAVWLVTCDRAQQISRLVERNGLSRADAERRVAAQPPTDGKLSVVDVVIDNSGSMKRTRDQVVAAWNNLVPGTPPGAKADA
ncbi:MAG TPA: dephospho-CoA kinase [Thermomicrobiales bacterium]